MENCTVLKDPVCGMTVTDKSFHQSEHMGQRYYFCGTKCKAKFAANMARYAGEPAQTGAAAVLPAPRRSGLNPGWMLVLAALGVLVIGGFWLV